MKSYMIFYVLVHDIIYDSDFTESSYYVSYEMTGPSAYAMRKSFQELFWKCKSI